MHTATQSTDMALTDLARQSVYRLRYDCYRRNSSIAASPDQLFHDRFDLMPNHFSFLQYRAAMPHATVRVSVVRPDLAWQDSPAQVVYGNHPAFQQLRGASYVEANRLCFATGANRQGFVELLGNVAALAELHQVDWLIACPRVEQAHVYQTLFGFQPLAEPRTYYGVNFAAQLMGVSFAQLHAFIQYDDRMIDSWAMALNNLRGIDTHPRIAAPPALVQAHTQHS